MKYLLLAAVLTCVSTSANAQSEWINFAASVEGETQWAVQPGSLEFSQTQGGTVIAVVIGRITDTKTSRIDLYKWYVSVSDCNKQMGKVVTLNIDGSYQFENDFVFGSGSIATAMAELICGAADYRIKEANEKSL
ncbi:MAG: hypothetical protein VW877_13815 [Pseudomonadaceae bacterium]